MALAHRGGRPYEDLVQARVIDRIGLQDTTFYPPQAMGPRLAESHYPDLKPMGPLDLGILTAAGALRSTPRDLSRFAAAILSGSGIAPEAELLLSVRRGAPWNGVQALGWELREAPGGAFVSKDGVCGQAASMVFDPEKGRAIVAFSNTMPDLSYSIPPGGGVGTADIARHLLRPQIPLGGQGGTRY